MDNTPRSSQQELNTFCGMNGRLFRDPFTLSRVMESKKTDLCVFVCFQHCSCSVTVTLISARQGFVSFQLYYQPVCVLPEVPFQGMLVAPSNHCLNPQLVVDLCKPVGVCMSGFSSHSPNTCKSTTLVTFKFSVHDCDCEWLSCATCSIDTSPPQFPPIPKF